MHSCAAFNEGCGNEVVLIVFKAQILSTQQLLFDIMVAKVNLKTLRNETAMK